MKNIAESLTDSDFELFRRRLEDSRIIEAETAVSLVTTLRDLWLVADEGYYYTYNDRLFAVTPAELSDFADRYFENKNPLVTVLVNPEVYEKIKAQFERNGFSLLYE